MDNRFLEFGNFTPYHFFLEQQAGQNQMTNPYAGYYNHFMGQQNPFGAWVLFITTSYFCDLLANAVFPSNARTLCIKIYSNTNLKTKILRLFFCAQHFGKVSKIGKKIYLKRMKKHFQRKIKIKYYIFNEHEFQRWLLQEIANKFQVFISFYR